MQSFLLTWCTFLFLLSKLNNHFEALSTQGLFNIAELIVASLCDVSRLGGNDSSFEADYACWISLKYPLQHNMECTHMILIQRLSCPWRIESSVVSCFKPIPVIWKPAVSGCTHIHRMHATAVCLDKVSTCDSGLSLWFGEIHWDQSTCAFSLWSDCSRMSLNRLFYQLTLLTSCCKPVKTYFVN